MIRTFLRSLPLLFLLGGVVPCFAEDSASYYGWGLPIQASSYAERIDNSMLILHVAMVLIFVIWGAFMTYCLIRFKAKPGSSGHYDHKATLLTHIPDALILVFEIWIIFFVGVPLWSHLMEEFPKEEDAHVVELVAEQFAWNFHFPGPDGILGRRDSSFISPGVNPIGLDPQDPAGKDDVVTINNLYIPDDKPTLLYLSSKDVIHSFFVPAFRMKRDVVPGMRIPMWFEPTKQGKFEIGCSQLCGLGHYRMRGDVIVVSSQEYRLWYEDQLKQKDIS